MSRIERFGSIRSPGAFDSSRQIEALANLGKQVQGIAFDVGARQQKAKGEKAGFEAGIQAAETGEAPQEKGQFFPSIFGESFNRSQQAAYVSSADRQALERLSQLETDHEYDSEGYTSNANALLQGVIEGAPESYRPVLHQSISNYISKGKMRVNNNIVQRGKEEAKSDLLGAIDTYSREASRAARNGDSEGAEELLGKADLSAKGLVDGGFWTEEQAEETILGSKNEIFRQNNKKAILDKAETDPSGAMEDLVKLGKTIPKDFTPDEWERVVDDIRTDLSRLMPRGGGSKREANDWLKRAKESLKFGFKLSEQDKAEGAALSASIGKTEEFDRLMKIEQFALLPESGRNSILKSMAGAETLDSQKDYIELQAIHNKIQSMAEEDGMTLAMRQGRLEPAVIEDGDMTARNEQADYLTELYGTRVGPYMESEIESFVNKIGEMTPADKANLAMSLGDNERTYQQLDKKNASLFAMVSARGDRDVANAVFAGQELIKTKQFKLPLKKDYMSDIEDYLGGPGEVYRIDDRATIIKAALSYYATIGEEAYDGGAMEKALTAVTGGIGELNGRKIELPRGVSEDDIEDLMDELQPETLEDFGGLKSNIPIEDIRDGQLISVGTNRYHLEIGGLRQYNKDGNPFEIEVTPELIMLNNSRRPKGRKRRKKPTIKRK